MQKFCAHSVAAYEFLSGETCETKFPEDVEAAISAASLLHIPVHTSVQDLAGAEHVLQLLVCVCVCVCVDVHVCVPFLHRVYAEHVQQQVRMCLKFRDSGPQI